jgi:hypothetical protein
MLEILKGKLSDLRGLSRRERQPIVPQGLFDWTLVDGQKHFVLMLALGVAVKFGASPGGKGSPRPPD